MVDWNTVQHSFMKNGVLFALNENRLIDDRVRLSLIVSLSF